MMSLKVKQDIKWKNNHSGNVPEGRFNWLFMDYGNLKVTPTDPHWKPSKMHEKFPF